MIKLKDLLLEEIKQSYKNWVDDFELFLEEDKDGGNYLRPHERGIIKALIKVAKEKKGNLSKSNLLNGLFSLFPDEYKKYSTDNYMNKYFWKDLNDLTENIIKEINENDRPKKLSDLQKFFKSKNIKEKITRGKGYYYFYGGDAAGWFQSGVSAYNIDDLTYKQWYEEYLTLSKNKY